MTRSFLFFIGLHLSVFSEAQPGVFSNKEPDFYTIKDCFKGWKSDSTFRTVVLPSNHVLMGTLIWRTIDLSNRVNQEVLSATKSCEELDLMEVIKFGLLERGRHAFYSDNFKLASKTLIQPQYIYSLLTVTDSLGTREFDNNGNQVIGTSVKRRVVSGADVNTYLIKEDWIFNSRSGRSEKKIIALAPLLYNEKTNKTLPLFWLYYPEWEGLFKVFKTTNLYSSEAITFWEVFEKRCFLSRISKESSLQDRSIRSYRNGTDADLESELIKEKLQNAEFDLFSH